MLGALARLFVDLFDIYLPTAALAPAIGYFIAPNLGQTGPAIAGGMIFTATLIGRPISTALYGQNADTLGKKRATVTAMGGADLTTLLLALLRGYAQLGVFSVILFSALCLAGGIFLGGESTAANPLPMEPASRRKRGLNSGLINTGFPLAYTTGPADYRLLITLLLLLAIPAQDIDSGYSQRGWRAPFVIGSVRALSLVAYYRRPVDES